MIATDRLILREFEPEDWQGVYDWCSDLIAMRFTMAGGAWSEENSRAYIEQAIAWARAQPRHNYAFAIALRSEKRLIGGCRLSIISGHRDAHIGFGLNRNYWNRGYATEALGALGAFGFAEIGLHRIFAESLAANIASLRVLEKIGMRREGHFRERYWMEERWWDALHYALLEDDWRSSLEP